MNVEKTRYKTFCNESISRKPLHIASGLTFYSNVIDNNQRLKSNKLFYF